MSFSIDSQLCTHLKRLDNYDKETLDRLCLSTFDFLKNGVSLESFQEENLKSIAKESMILIVQSLKFNISDSELNDLLSSIECNAYYRDQLVQNYQQYKLGLSKILLAYNTNSDNRYVHLQWKFEVKVASKYLREQLVPSIILRFQTTDHEGTSTCFDIQCSIADIYQMVEKLGNALRKSNSQHCIKLLRHIK